jgi:hypothetical protein
MPLRPPYAYGSLYEWDSQSEESTDEERCVLSRFPHNLPPCVVFISSISSIHSLCLTSSVPIVPLISLPSSFGVSAFRASMILTISLSFSLLDFRWPANSNQIHSTRLPQRLLPCFRPCSLSLFRFGSTSAIDDFLFRKPHDVTLFRLLPTTRISSSDIRSCAPGTSAWLRNVLVLLMVNSTTELRCDDWDIFGPDAW